MNDFKSISVTKGEDNNIIVTNPTEYPLVGKGAQGAVFQLSDTKCVKIYPVPSNALKEREALSSAHSLPFVPKMFEYGSNYIVMDFFKGPSLNEYLKVHRTMTESMSKELYFMLIEMKRTGFTRVDLPPRHVIMTENGLKLVDHVNSFTKIEPKPMRLFNELAKWGLLLKFLQQVKEIDPEIYQEWGEEERN